MTKKNYCAQGVKEVSRKESPIVQVTRIDRSLPAAPDHSFLLLVTKCLHCVSDITNMVHKETAWGRVVLHNLRVIRLATLSSPFTACYLLAYRHSPLNCILSQFLEVYICCPEIFQKYKKKTLQLSGGRIVLKKEFLAYDPQFWGDLWTSM